MPRVARLGEARLAIWGCRWPSVVTVRGFGFANAVWMVLVLLPMAALTDLVPPTLMAMSANTVDEDRQGMVQGVIASLSSLSAVRRRWSSHRSSVCSSRAIWASTCRARRSCSPRFWFAAIFPLAMRMRRAQRPHMP
jgi:hypothetical protein